MNSIYTVAVWICSSPLNYSTAQLDSSRAALRRLYTALKRFADAGGKIGVDNPMHESSLMRFEQALNDDLNSAEALAVLHDLANSLNKSEAGSSEAAQLATTLKTLGERLGLLCDDPVSVLQRAVADNAMDEAAIQNLIDERIAARAAKDFARSDEIRDALVEAGIILEDNDGETTWRRG